MFDTRGPMTGAAFAAEEDGSTEGSGSEGEAAHQLNNAVKVVPPSGGGEFSPSIPASASPSDLLLEAHERDGVLFVSGDIDLYEAAQFRSFAEAYIATTDAPRLDLTDVSFIDSAGLAALLMLSREAKVNEKTLTVIATGAPRRVLRITGIDQAIIVEG